MNKQFDTPINIYLIFSNISFLIGYILLKLINNFAIKIKRNDINVAKALYFIWYLKLYFPLSRYIWWIFFSVKKNALVTIAFSNAYISKNNFI